MKMTNYENDQIRVNLDLSHLLESPWLDHGAYIGEPLYYQSPVKEQTLINTFTMGTAVDAAVIRKLRKWLPTKNGPLRK